MIDVADSSKVYYYHFDGLGSVVALSNSSGTSCQSYVYSAYGRVWAEYEEFTANPYMFTGRRFDYETGLYYYRARYYNPYIGRFLQTDPVGYGDGINWYAYCGNNPIVCVDPSGLATYFYDGRNCSMTELSGEWNLHGLGVQFNCDPCYISELDCGEDTYYILDCSAEYIRYWPKDVEVLMGASDSSNFEEADMSVYNEELGLWESIKIVWKNNPYLISGGWESSLSYINPFTSDEGKEIGTGMIYPGITGEGIPISYTGHAGSVNLSNVAFDIQSVFIIGLHNESDLVGDLTTYPVNVGIFSGSIFYSSDGLFLGFSLGPGVGLPGFAQVKREYSSP